MDGDNGVSRTALDTIVLTYDRTSDRLEIGGHCNSLDLMLDMLARATRTLENKWRAERVMELRQQLADASRTASIFDKVRGGG